MRSSNKNTNIKTATQEELLHVSKTRPRYYTYSTISPLKKNLLMVGFSHEMADVQCYAHKHKNRFLIETFLTYTSSVIEVVSKFAVVSVIYSKIFFCNRRKYYVDVWLICKTESEIEKRSNSGLTEKPRACGNTAGMCVKKKECFFKCIHAFGSKSKRTYATILLCICYMQVYPTT